MKQLEGTNGTPRSVFRPATESRLAAYRVESAIGFEVLKVAPNGILPAPGYREKLPVEFSMVRRLL